MRYFVLCATLLLAGCSTVGLQKGADNQITVVELTTEQVAAVQAGVKDALKDPYSAVFGSAKASPQTDGKLRVCGFVNAKNAMGGYVGNSPYVGTLNGDAFVVEVMGPDALYGFDLCKQMGVTG